MCQCHSDHTDGPSAACGWSAGASSTAVSPGPSLTRGVASSRLSCGGAGTGASLPAPVGVRLRRRGVAPSL